MAREEIRSSRISVLGGDRVDPSGANHLSAAPRRESAGGDERDPDLSENGRGRAARLAKMLKDAAITKFFATQIQAQPAKSRVAGARDRNSNYDNAREEDRFISRATQNGARHCAGRGASKIPFCDRQSARRTDTIDIGESDFDWLFLVIAGEAPCLLELLYP